MIAHKISSVISAALFCLLLLSCKKGKTATPPLENPPTTNIAVPLAGNAYITHLPAGATEEISNNGLSNWTNKESITSTYFSLGQTGTLSVAIKAKVIAAGSSVVSVTINGTAFTIKLAGSDYKTYFAGTVNIATAGYVKVELQGISKTGNYFAAVSDVMIGGTATESDLIFANDLANFYWSRRGPSCHLNYTIPSADKEYFYSELTVPAGEDKIASYFMANGFGEGYFGIQVNSATERRVLFSVWDPATGQGQTTLLRKGPGVTAGTFGGEGTGGQSYLLYNWKAGNTYKFLTKAKPDGAGSTIYTSWFFAPEEGSWRLIASFSRPNISTYLTRFHGFLENFDPAQGYLSRQAAWSNQWVYLAGGGWNEVTEFKFSVDATASNKQRLDCTGGVENGHFFLKNGGFFNNGVAPQTLFTKPATGIPPGIDFNALP
jgi:hypothetical protein